MIDESTQHHTNLTSIVTLILKEHRLERGIQQAILAERLGKNPSNFNKIEAGKTPLTMDVFLAICSNLAINPSLVMGLAESYRNVFANAGWVVMSSSLPESDDDLLSEANEYYSSPVFKNRGISNIALNAPYLDFSTNNYYGIEVFGYAMYPNMKHQLKTNRVITFNSLLNAQY
ncbi:helix-turn-helix transcriptional regulator [Citrobacter freundii]|nr:helix-turn-helix transcriptional regulator [Citrobacter freundii]MBA8334584.1 helix-turn-helix transcriptional regulator [Citrobacter freundii]QLM85404.1 helix-turn-helix transcriptional regulator [Citrobacter freundii]QMM21364.1 helix-turn-helix transcriptional regulator [Citrobacter freundii]